MGSTTGGRIQILIIAPYPIPIPPEPHSVASLPSHFPCASPTLNHPPSALPQSSPQPLPTSAPQCHLILPQPPPCSPSLPLISQGSVFPPPGRTPKMNNPSTKIASRHHRGIGVKNQLSASWGRPAGGKSEGSARWGRPAGVGWLGSPSGDGPAMVGRPAGDTTREVGQLVVDSLRVGQMRRGFFALF